MNTGRKIQGVVGVLIILAILILINVIFSGVRIRADLTDEKLFTLSDGTRQLLKELQRDVTLKFYFSESAPGIPVPVKQYARRIRDLLKEYELKSGGKVLVETYDPRPDSDAEEWADRYGLTGRGLTMLGEGPKLYLGLVAVSGSREAALPFLSPQIEPQLEYLVTRLINEVNQERKPRVAVISSLPVMGSPQMMMPMGRGQPPWIAISELRKQYEVTQISENLPDIPPGTDLLLLIHPRNLSEQVWYAVDQYIMRGGRVLAFVDPACLVAAQSEEGMYGGQAARSDLNRLSEAWGIGMDPGKMIADLRAGTPIRVGPDRAERSPSWLSLRENNVNRDDVATSLLNYLMLPFVGAFTGKPNANLTMEILLHSSDEAGLVDSSGLMMGFYDTRKEFEKLGRPLPIALRLKGRFPSAFPGGLSGSNVLAGAQTPLAQGTNDAVVVLVGDADFISDQYAVEQMNFFGQSVAQLANDNLNFLLNMVEQLSGSEALIGLRSRGTYDRPFTRVVELEKAAQERWQAEERKLTEKLQKTQARLRELEMNKDKDQRFILSPEQKKEIEQFRQEQFQTERELKEVRKNLRYDIEVLGIKLKVLNIVAVPALVALFGVARGAWRRARAGA